MEEIKIIYMKKKRFIEKRIEKGNNKRHKKKMAYIMYEKNVARKHRG